jgi:hypothetical protein
MMILPIRVEHALDVAIHGFALATAVAHAGICKVERDEAFAPPGSAT